MEPQDISSKLSNVAIETTAAAVDASPASLTDECAVSMTASHDRMDTQSNFTHVEVESVVSSWLDDDDTFFQMAMQDIKVSEIPQQRMPAGKGWKVASSKNSRSSHFPPSNQGSSTTNATTQPSGQGQSSRHRGKASGSSGGNQPASTPLSGGRFDALAGDGRRRW